jgi:hypothetical protein
MSSMNGSDARDTYVPGLEAPFFRWVNDPVQMHPSMR